MTKRVPKILDACCCTLLAVGLAGCGQKGPLYLPGPATAPSTVVVEPPAAASAPAAAPIAAPLPIPPATR